jgi:Flp pilus assembly protein TadB
MMDNWDSEPRLSQSERAEARDARIAIQVEQRRKRAAEDYQWKLGYEANLAAARERSPVPADGGNYSGVEDFIKAALIIAALLWVLSMFGAPLWALLLL